MQWFSIGFNQDPDFTSDFKWWLQHDAKTVYHLKLNFESFMLSETNHSFNKACIYNQTHIIFHIFFTAFED